MSFADNTIVQYHLFAEDPTEAAMTVFGALPRPWTSHFEMERKLKDHGSHSLLEWANNEWAVPATERDKKGEKYPWAGKNPLAVARLSCDTDITAMAYSPDGRWLAVTTKDGLLRLIDTEVNRWVFGWLDPEDPH